MSFTEALTRRVVLAARSERPALIVNGEATSYSDLAGATGALQDALLRVGVRPGDHVCICSSARRDFVLGVLAAWMSGATAVPLPDNDLEQTRDILSSIRPRAVIGTEAALAEVARPDNEVALVRVPAEQRMAPKAVIGVRADSLAVMLHSSGTTSAQRKSVEIPDHVLDRVIANLNEAVTIPSQVTEYLMSPPSHALGFARLCAVLARAGTLVMDDGLFNPLQVLAGLRKHACGSLSGVASGFMLLIEKFPEQLSDYGRFLRWMEIGSIPMPVARKQELLELLPHAEPVMEYGLTESMRSTFVNYRRMPKKLGTVGRAAAGVEVVALDADCQPVPAGQEGEIAVRGSHLARGYWQLPQLWAARLANDWFRTGDWGHLDEDQFVHFLARHDDVINSGGHKISPDEVEGLLAEFLPDMRYAVIGKPDPILGEIPILCIEGQERPKCDSDLRVAIGSRLPAWKQPREVRFVDALPRTANGKLQRRKLKQLLSEPVKGEL